MNGVRAEGKLKTVKGWRAKWAGLLAVLLAVGSTTPFGG